MTLTVDTISKIATELIGREMTWLGQVCEKGGMLKRPVEYCFVTADGYLYLPESVFVDYIKINQ
jgi:hypothetical protein